MSCSKPFPSISRVLVPDPLESTRSQDLGAGIRRPAQEILEAEESAFWPSASQVLKSKKMRIRDLFRALDEDT